MFYIILSVLILTLMLAVWRITGQLQKELQRNSMLLRDNKNLAEEARLVRNRLAEYVPLPAPQQTRIFGDSKTEDLIASWLERGWSPLGDDLTDTESSLQIAARIRRGEYLDELVSSENQQELRGDAG